ncbi:MAG: alanine:cation symporter family protein [Nannocystaceae bacterium]|nr:alanine:cation symporter family protein [bacterium]
MERLLEGLWNPLLGGFVLCAGLLLLAGTGLLPFRRLSRLRAGWRVGAPSGPMLLVATSASLTSITAAVMAVTVAGPGALVWMWIAGLLGTGLHFGEAKLARANVAAGKPALPAPAAFGVLAVGVLAGGLWQGSQAAVILEDTLELPAVFGAAAVAVGALAASRIPRVATMAIRWLPLVGTIIFALLVGGIAFDEPFALKLALGDAINEAFGLQSATAGTVGGALSVLIAHGMMRAVSAADLGVGAAAAAVSHGDEPLDPDAAGASVMVVPLLIVGVLSTLAGLAVLTAPPEPPLADDRLFPLERPDSRGLRASQQVGQTVVLREETELDKGQQYAMMLRASPRGHTMAKFYEKENAVILPAWAVASGVDTLYFRARDPKRARQPAWDVQVPCNRELFGGQGDAPQFVRLTPKDPELVLREFIAFYELDEKPYVNVDDFSFIGAVALANSPDEQLGEHLAMFEYRGEETPFNPRLHEFFRNQFSGPFPDDDAEAPPVAFIAAEGFDAPIGSRVQVELRAPQRGADILRVNRIGQAEAPPWRSLLELEEIVIRHADDRNLDIRVPVAPRLDGKRIRLDVLDPAWKDLRKIEKDELLSGPFAVMPDVPFEVEVHSDVRLPPTAAGRRSLVPLHEDLRPRGPQERELYDPHPGELVRAGFAGPYLPRNDVGVLLRRVEANQPRWGTTALGIAALLLAVSTTLGWSLLVRGPAAALLGPAGGVIVPLVICAIPLVGGVVGPSLSASLGLLAYSVAAVPVLVLLVLQLAKVRNSSGS